MQRISLWLWAALGGAILELVALGSNFYRLKDGARRDAWLGVPHVSDLLLASAVVTIVLLVLAAANRSPTRGRWVGFVVGGVGLLAAWQTFYRIAVPPFGGCLTYGDCGFSPRPPGEAATILVGMWIGLAGALLATLGGFVHAFTGAAERTGSRFWRAEEPTPMTPWLGVAALAAVAQFVFGYTIFDFYSVVSGGETSYWSGWIASPHTASLVLLATLVVLGLVLAAARGRSPLAPPGLGAAIAVVGFVAAARIFFRILEPPFHTGPAEGVFGSDGAVLLPGYLSLASALAVLAAGVAQVVVHRQAEPAARRRLEEHQAHA